MRENELVNRIISGDEKAEAIFVDLYYEKIKVIVHVRIGNREDREEIINDILIAAIIKIRQQKYKEAKDASLTKYVHGIARNTINQYYKNYYQRSNREENFKKMEALKMALIDLSGSTYENKEEIVTKKKLLENSIAKLKSKYRRVIYLKYYEDLSNTEISEIMNIHPQKVSDYIKYAKQLLTKNLKKRNIFP